MSLSNKREKHFKTLTSNPRWLYPEEDVREFIKRLDKWKEIMKTWHVPLPTIVLLCNEFDRFIIEEAGEKLTQKRF